MTIACRPLLCDNVVIPMIQCCGTGVHLDQLLEEALL